MLTDYVAGALRPAFAIVTASHVQGCPTCRDQVRRLEHVGGDLLSELPAAQMPADVITMNSTVALTDLDTSEEETPCDAC